MSDTPSLENVSEVWPVALDDDRDPTLSAILPSKRPAVRLLHIGRVTERLRRMEGGLLKEDLAGLLAMTACYHALVEKAKQENDQLCVRIKELEAALARLN